MSTLGNRSLLALLVLSCGTLTAMPFRKRCEDSAIRNIALETDVVHSDDDWNSRLPRLRIETAKDAVSDPRRTYSHNAISGIQQIGLNSHTIVAITEDAVVACSAREPVPPKPTDSDPPKLPIVYSSGIEPIVQVAAPD